MFEQRPLSLAGPRILVVMPSGPSLANIILTTWSLGRTLALLKPSATQHEQKKIVDDFQPHSIVREGERGQIIEETRPAPDEHPDPVADGSITVFTSGTTGPPKGVIIPRAALIGNARKTAALHGIGEGRPHGTCLSLFHVNALVMSLLGTHLTGEKLVLAELAHPVEYFAALRAGVARTASVNPMELRRIVEAAPSWPDSLDYLITAAGPCSASLANAFYELYGPRLRQGYGMSEAVNFSFVMPVLNPTDFKEHYLNARPPIGLPLQDTAFRIENDELWIRTPDRMLGYLGGVPSIFDSENWLRTGDCALIRDGLVVLRGRATDALRAGGGQRTLPADVEDFIALPVKCGEHAVVRVPAHPGEPDDAALYLAGGWAPEVSDWLLGVTRPIPRLILTGRIQLSGSGKVQRDLMAREARAFLAKLSAQMSNMRPLDKAQLAAIIPGRPAGNCEFVVQVVDPPLDHAILADWERTDLTGKAFAKVSTPTGSKVILWGWSR